MTAKDDKEQAKISKKLRLIRERLDGLFFVKGKKRLLKIDGQERALLRLSIVQLEIIRAKNGERH